MVITNTVRTDILFKNTNSKTRFVLCPFKIKKLLSVFRILILNLKVTCDLITKRVGYSQIFLLLWFAFWKPISLAYHLKKYIFKKKICPVLFLPKNYLVLLAYSDRYLIYTLWGSQLRKLHKFEIFSWRKLNSHKTWLKTSLHVPKVMSFLNFLLTIINVKIYSR